MAKTSVITNIRNQFIDDYLENSKKIPYNELNDSKLVKVLYKDLQNTEIDGYPFASDFVDKDGIGYTIDEFTNLSDEKKKECELRYYYLPNYHELYVGTTGSGKTTGCVEPQLRAISSQKNKPNLFLTDPKGELFNRNAKHLKENGYKLYVLNFKDLQHSNKWNPLTELYDEKIKLLNIDANKKYVAGKVPENLEIFGNKEDFTPIFIEYNGKAFPNEETYEDYIAFEKDFIEAKIDSLINQFAHMLIKVQSNTDKSWEYGSQDLVKGILHCMLEDAVNPKKNFTRDMMSLRTLHRYYAALKDPILRNAYTLNSHPLMAGKSEKTKLLMATALHNAPNTMRSYCGVFDGSTKDWFQAHIFALTTGNTIDIDVLDDEPFAIFLITRDYEKSDFLIAGLFIDWIYRKMIEKNESISKPRPLHFLLDEFGNIPEIRDFENKIATARSRNIWFHLVVQSYKQIDFIYGAERSIIIRDNCNAQVFLGAQNMETKEIFSNQCGRHTIPSLQSKLNVNDNSIIDVPLVPVSQLDLINPGQIYLKRIYLPVILSQFIRSYICAEYGIFDGFINPVGLKEYTPFEIDSFSSKRYTYDLSYEEDY